MACSSGSRLLEMCSAAATPVREDWKRGFPPLLLPFFYADGGRWREAATARDAGDGEVPEAGEMNSGRGGRRWRKNKCRSCESH